MHTPHPIREPIKGLVDCNYNTVPPPPPPPSSKCKRICSEGPAAQKGGATSSPTLFTLVHPLQVHFTAATTHPKERPSPATCVRCSL